MLSGRSAYSPPDPAKNRGIAAPSAVSGGQAKGSVGALLLLLRTRRGRGRCYSRSFGHRESRRRPRCRRIRRLRAVVAAIIDFLAPRAVARGDHQPADADTQQQGGDRIVTQCGAEIAGEEATLGSERVRHLAGHLARREARLKESQLADRKSTR